MHEKSRCPKGSYCPVQKNLVFVFSMLWQTYVFCFRAPLFFIMSPFSCACQTSVQEVWKIYKNEKSWARLLNNEIYKNIICIPGFLTDNSEAVNRALFESRPRKSPFSILSSHFNCLPDSCRIQVTSPLDLPIPINCFPIWSHVGRMISGLLNGII